MLFYQRAGLSVDKYLPNIEGKVPYPKEMDEESEAEYKKQCVMMQVDTWAQSTTVYSTLGSTVIRVQYVYIREKNLSFMSQFVHSEHWKLSFYIFLYFVYTLYSINCLKIGNIINLSFL